MNKGAKKNSIFIIILVLALLLLFFAAVNIGSLQVGAMQLLRGLFIAYDPDVAVVYDLRFPRILIAIAAGASISAAGVLFQAVLKNPLADPGIIGISSGASCVAVLVTALFPSLYFLTPFFAFCGGIAAFFLVYSLSWKGGLSPLRIILVGIAVSAMFTGISSGINSMSGGSLSGVASIVEGSITLKTWSDVKMLVVYALPGLLIAIFSYKHCNILALEDKTIRGLGIPVNVVRIVISLIAVLLTSISTAVVGTVSFLGLIVPHALRMIVGSDHKVLLPASMLGGAFIFLLADTLGRTIAYPYEISPSILMAVAGGPFFIFMLRRSTKYGS